MNIPLNINWQQILLHLLNFAILAGGLYFLLYAPVKKFMAQRILHYQEMEDDARKKVSEAEQLKEDYAGRLKEAEQEIYTLRAKAMRSAKEQSDLQLEKASKQAETILAEAKRSAEHSREKVMQEAQKELKDLAVTATEKLLLKSGGDPIDQFLSAAEQGGAHTDERHG